jgi:hypothetical protein
MSSRIAIAALVITAVAESHTDALTSVVGE